MPITLSGFNSIDFNLILNSIMQQESQPLAKLQTQQAALQSQSTNFSTLATKLTAVQSAAETLYDASTLTPYTATSTDSTTASATVGSSATTGVYDVVVQELARSQVTESSSSTPDVNTTVVATGGKITIGGVDVNITSSVTLTGLRDAINSTANIGVTASIVADTPTTNRLVLTSKNTGAANAFVIVNALTGGTGVAFTNPNAVQATDASVLVNNIQITSASNTLTSAIPGATLTVSKKAPTTTVTISVAVDNAALKNKISSFVSAYNGLLSFISSQTASAAKGDPSSIGRDPLVRNLKSTLSGTVLAKYDTGGTYKYLTEVGVGFDRTGTMTFNGTAFDTAIAQGTQDIAKLFTNAGTGNGAFVTIDTLIKSYTQFGGFVTSAQTNLTNEVSRMADQITRMQDRLSRRRASLQQQFIAADQAMSSLKSQSGTLASFGTLLQS